MQCDDAEDDLGKTGKGRYVFPRYARYAMRWRRTGFFVSGDEQNAASRRCKERTAEIDVQLILGGDGIPGVYDRRAEQNER